MGIVEFDEYKGRELMVLKGGETDRYPFKFGLKKAKLMVEHIDDIRKWVEEQEAKQSAMEAEGGEPADD